MKHKVVAFLDILGWKELVALAERDAAAAQLVQIALQIMRETPCYNPHHGVYFSTFSDSLLISADPTPGGLSAVLQISELVSMNLISQCERLVRGGIVLGPLTHNEKGEWGSALASAHQLCELKGAPGRVACSDEVAQLIEEVYQDSSKQLLRSHRVRGKTEHYINTLWHFEYPDPRNPRPGQLVLEGEAGRIVALIERSLASHNPAKVQRKWLWFRAAWNRSVRRNGVLAKVVRRGSVASEAGGPGRSAK
ncbi:hypothetical protein [Novosphingobium beihaiensis]|uniref:Guanylate cyclase domain-containing protein n=1 Tax=Novosphingobium beihaiensis TaxID=2930389 RepID=A0ABT0BQX4_9SPHN|nr:hypothetical protein [Novosphingobium beihaiensis]MCJ2187447.1 hypothetical protein [Novosphingobium beihaiensis]